MIWLWAWVGQAVAVPVDSWLDAVVRLEQGSTHCAGTTVSPQGLVLTAYHCVASGGAVHVAFRDGSDAQGRVVSRPFAGPVIDGERPLLQSTFFAPGAPRSLQVGARLHF